MRNASLLRYVLINLTIISCLGGCDSPTKEANSVDAPSESPDGSNSTNANTDSSLSSSADDSADNHSTSNNAPSSTTATSKQPAGDANEVIDISFDDIELLIQEDIVFRPQMLTARAKELDGKRVRINGFMLPDTKIRNISQFVLLKNLECKFGPGGRADHLLNVIMLDDRAVNFREDAISIEGQIVLNPFNGPDGNTWSIYDFKCTKVEKYRPRR
ncbi:MAG: hypothetical protein R3C28_01005 [Pirellulaceae bacterium]